MLTAPSTPFPPPFQAPNWTPIPFPFPSSLPAIPFTFSTSTPTTPEPSPPLPSSRKRSRATEHISLDRPPLPSSKKRRLRLVFITSRLSRPFSKPASHIVDHGKSRVALWAKMKRLGGLAALRKAAILNQVRLSGYSDPRRPLAGVNVASTTTVATYERPKVWFDSVEDVRGEADGVASRRVFSSSVSPVLPSPLGLSNYAALDDWHATPDEDEDDSPPESRWGGRLAKPDDPADGDGVYSDFNLLDDPVRADEIDDVAFSILPPEMDLLRSDRPPSPPDEPFVELMRGKGGVGEVSYFAVA